MLSNIRKFSTSIWAKMLLGIIIIPFVFWGMGGVFSGGNKNTLAKINNHNISTQDFMKHLNTLQITEELIRKEIDNSIIEQILNDLVRKEILLLEMKNLKLQIPNSSLSMILKKNKKFLDSQGNFSRTSYEKFLLENNMNASIFEERFKSSELKKLLFYYIGGGIYPPKFLINKTFNSQNKNITLKGIKIENIYKKNNEIKDIEITNFINLNKDKLKENFLTLSLARLTPSSLTLSDEFNEQFFEKIDFIEQDIVNGKEFKDLINDYNLKKIKIDKLNKNDKDKLKEYNFSDDNINKILNNTKINEIKLFDNGDEFIIINIDKISEILPDLNSDKFKLKIKKRILDENKFELNTSILKKINTNNFSNNDFLKLASTNNLKIESFTITSIKDNKLFHKDSLKEIFTLNTNKYTFALDKNLNTYLLFIENINNKNINTTDTNFKKFFLETGINLKQNIYSSYDNYIQSKYNITINQKTLSTVKNYFK